LEILKFIMVFIVLLNLKIHMWYSLVNDYMFIAPITIFIIISVILVIAMIIYYRIDEMKNVSVLGCLLFTMVIITIVSVYTYITYTQG